MTNESVTGNVRKDSSGGMMAGESLMSFNPNNNLPLNNKKPIEPTFQQSNSFSENSYNFKTGNQSEIYN